MSWLELSDNSRLWYQERGHGQPLLLIHGWCQAATIWEWQLEDLSDRFRVIALDLPGHGKSTLAADGFTLNSAARGVSQLCQALDLQQLLLLGWSLGGAVALETLPLISGRCAGMILTGYTPRFTTADDWLSAHPLQEVEGMGRLLRKHPQQTRERFMERMFTDTEQRDPGFTASVGPLLARVAAPDTAAALQGLKILAENDQRDRLEEYQLPCLILQGEGDSICPAPVASYLARKLAEAELVQFAGCGHAPFLTRRSEFNGSITRFAGRICGNQE